jgi:acetyltransferase-like isoleucine patch superfamily enzyme
MVCSTAVHRQTCAEERRLDNRHDEHDGGDAAGRWSDGAVPANVRLGLNVEVSGEFAFKRFLSQRDPGLVIGAHSTMDDVHFAVGQDGRIDIGEYCFLSGALLLCEAEITIGSYVVCGWNVTIADTDFHPVSPAERIADAIAVSPLGNLKDRPPIVRRPVVIGDDVWIGPAATILKGVTIGDGAFIEPGAVVLRDVAAGDRVLGNPAQSVLRS